MANQKEYFITVNGEKVPVTEEVYREYWCPVWRRRKQQERAQRCRIEHGKRCTGDCNRCPHEKNGSVLSLDEFAAVDGYEPSDNIDLADLVAHKVLLEQLDLALGELSETDRKIIVLHLNGHTERDIAGRVGLAQKTVNNHKNAALTMLRERLSKFR